MKKLKTLKIEFDESQKGNPDYREALMQHIELALDSFLGPTQRPRAKASNNKKDSSERVEVNDSTIWKAGKLYRELLEEGLSDDEIIDELFAKFRFDSSSEKLKSQFEDIKQIAATGRLVKLKE